MDLFFQLLINGLSAGSIYALIAAGWALIFGVSRIFHMAYGGLAILAAYVAYSLVQIGLQLWVAALIASLVAAAGAWVIYRLFYKKLAERHAPPLVIWMTSIGLLMVLENLVHLLYGPDARYFTGQSGFFQIGSLTLSRVDALTILASLLLLTGFSIFLRRTRTGTAVRAVTSNRSLAALMGINLTRVDTTAFLVGSALGLPGILASGLRASIAPAMGTEVVLMAAICAIVGGVGNVAGAVAAGYLIGLAEAMAVWKFSGQWQSAVSFGVLFLTLLLRPNGLFVTGAARRA